MFSSLTGFSALVQIKFFLKKIIAVKINIFFKILLYFFTYDISLSNGIILVHPILRNNTFQARSSLSLN
jgi:hypothetical protein